MGDGGMLNGQIRAHIETLMEQHGGCVTAEEVVADAARPDSPLHACFEWDDAKAAGLFRLEQARHLLRSVEVQLHTPAGNMRTVRGTACVTVQRDGQAVTAYVKMERALAEPELRAQVIATALNEAKAWSARYQQYQELWPICAAIDGVQVHQSQPELKLAA